VNFAISSKICVTGIRELEIMKALYMAVNVLRLSDYLMFISSVVSAYRMDLCFVCKWHTIVKYLFSNR